MEDEMTGKISRRAVLGGGLALGAAAVLVKAQPAAARASVSTQTGAVLTGSNATYATQYMSLTGLTPQILRVYLLEGDPIPTSAQAARLLQFYEEDMPVVYSLKPDKSPDSATVNYANLKALAENIATLGYASLTRIVLHHEPYAELTAAQFISMYEYYAPAVRGAGIRCGAIFQTYPIYHGDPTYGTDYTNGIIPLIDFIGIDTYPQDTIGATPPITDDGYSADILSTISPLTTLAKGNGKPFLITEIGFNDNVPGSGTAIETSWMEKLDGLGSDVAAVIYFGIVGGATDMADDPAQTIPAWQNVAANMAAR